ncbi:MAG: N-acetyltransferase [Bacillales bacterium]|nr:N-acetyltransferase [Bacillales bacterium]
MLSHKGTNTIITDRLILRRFELSDAINMFKNWASDSDVTRFLTWETHSDIEVTKGILEQWLNDYKETNTYHWAIELNEISEVIGGIAVFNIDEQNLSCELGYCMSKTYWGKGIMSETLEGVMDYLFSEIGFNRITAKHNTNNVASGKVMVKSGMTYEGTLKQAYLRNKKEFCDMAIYAILKSEWLRNKRIEQ